jgi:hypothetical protein
MVPWMSQKVGSKGLAELYMSPTWPRVQSWSCRISSKAAAVAAPSSTPAMV